MRETRPAFLIEFQALAYSGAQGFWSVSFNHRHLVANIHNFYFIPNRISFD